LPVVHRSLGHAAGTAERRITRPFRALVAALKIGSNRGLRGAEVGDHWL